MLDSALREATLSDAQPFLPRDPKSVWSRAAELSERIQARIERVCAELGVSALVTRSIEFVFPAEVTLTAWLPTEQAGLTNRVRLQILIEPKPHHAYEFEYSITCIRLGRTRKYAKLHTLSDDDVAAWSYHILRRDKVPRWRRNRLRRWRWALWRRRNRISRRSWRSFNPRTLVALCFIVPGVVLLGQVESSAEAALLGVALLLLGLPFAWRAWRTPKLYLNSGRPGAGPRVLRLADTWQALLEGIGGSAEDARTRLLRRLSEPTARRRSVRVEKIWYITPDGKEEREQIVISDGRAIVFCHIYPYDSDLFVGWDAHVNLGEWAEKEIGSTYNNKLKGKVVLQTVTPARGSVTEYDLIDLNSLIEWVHSRLVQVTKQMVSEFKLDQEIDFRIVRGERQGLVGERSRADGKADRPRFSFRRSAAA